MKEEKISLKVEDMKVMEYPTLDLEQYEGNKAKINTVELKKFPSNYDPSGEQWCIRVATETVLSIPARNDDEADLDICGSELFNVIQDEEEGIGWGKKSNLAKFLAKMNVNHPKDLMGKNVTLRVIKKKKNGEEEKQYLGFIRE